MYGVNTFPSTLYVKLAMMGSTRRKDPTMIKLNQEAFKSFIANPNGEVFEIRDSLYARIDLASGDRLSVRLFDNARGDDVFYGRITKQGEIQLAQDGDNKEPIPDNLEYRCMEELIFFINSKAGVPA